MHQKCVNLIFLCILEMISKTNRSELNNFVSLFNDIFKLKILEHDTVDISCKVFIGTYFIFNFLVL